MRHLRRNELQFQSVSAVREAAQQGFDLFAREDYALRWAASQPCQDVMIELLNHLPAAKLDYMAENYLQLIFQEGRKEVFDFVINSPKYDAVLDRYQESVLGIFCDECHPERIRDVFQTPRFADLLQPSSSRLTSRELAFFAKHHDLDALETYFEFRLPYGTEIVTCAIQILFNDTLRTQEYDDLFQFMKKHILSHGTESSHIQDIYECLCKSLENKHPEFTRRILEDSHLYDLVCTTTGIRALHEALKHSNEGFNELLKKPHFKAVLHKNPEEFLSFAYKNMKYARTAESASTILKIFDQPCDLNDAEALLVLSASDPAALQEFLEFVGDYLTAQDITDAFAQSWSSNWTEIHDESIVQFFNSGVPAEVIVKNPRGESLKHLLAEMLQIPNESISEEFIDNFRTQLKQQDSPLMKAITYEIFSSVSKGALEELTAMSIAGEQLNTDSKKTSRI